METQIFYHAKIYFKRPSARNQNPSRYYNSITNLKVSNTSQNIIFQKSSYKNRSITLGPKSLQLLNSIMNLNTISLPTKHNVIF